MGKKNEPVKYFVVDAFTDSPFRGNPAAVCLLDDERDDGWLQSVATEFNLSETCYLTPIVDRQSPIPDSSSSTPRYRLRWFTPVAEVKLCGHATLASSYVLFTSVLVNADKIEFETLSGVLTAKRVPESQDEFSIELDFPVDQLTEFDSVEVSSISKVLNGSSVIDMKKTTHEGDLFASYLLPSNIDDTTNQRRSQKFVLAGAILYLVDFDKVVLSSGQMVADLQPQFDEIQRCPGLGLIVTGLAPSGSGFDFFSRYFCPKLGIKEDPVTGSVHCALAVYWSQKLGKSDFVAYQASPRGGIINIHLDEERQRVLLRGKAVAITHGSLLV